MIFQVPEYTGLPFFGQSLNYLSDPLKFIEKCEKKFGKIVKLYLTGVPYYYIFDPEMISEVFRDTETFIKEDEVSHSLFGEGLLTSNGPLWEVHRKVANRFFSAPKINNDYAPIFTQLTLDFFKNNLSNQKKLDIHQFFSELTLRMIVRTIFERDIEQNFNEIRLQMNKILRYLEITYALPMALPKSWKLKYVKDFDAAIEFFNEMLFDYIDKDNQNSFVSALKSTGDVIGSRKRIRDQFMTFFIAGHETTALLLSYTIHLLSKHPDILINLLEELASVNLNENTEAFDVKKLISLPYFDRVIKESLRIYSPVYANVRFTSKKTIIYGYPLDEKCFVLISPFIQQRNKKYFDRPLEFLPDRWLDKSIDERNYFPFGGGQRFCLGKNFALCESKIILYYFLKYWHFESAEPFNNLKLRAALTSMPKNGIYGKLHYRIAPFKSI